MKIIVIGDIHGLNTWEDVLKAENYSYDKVVFLGDYWDSFNKSYPEQLDNFNNILKFKTENPDNVILLLGNHDIHYITGNRASGYQDFHSIDIKHLLKDNISHFKMVYQWEKYMFSHAGVTNEFLKRLNITDNVVDELNKTLIFYPTLFDFVPCYTIEGNLGSREVLANPYGDNVWQSCIWVRPESLNRDCLNKFIHVVGHTATQEPKFMGNNIILNDTLHNNYYLIIQDGEVYVRKID